MGIIRLLDTATTNKIAAGEVVASPASVVKELVENSLDAGSSRITIEIVSGGIGLIKVADNGSGIVPEDIEKAFMRHATSKIQAFRDLDTVTTMGFRGEALASIAAVSRITLTSKQQGNNEGVQLSVEGGCSGKPVPVGCAEGTTVEVVDLFYNVPVRKKFLKSPSRETAGVNEIVSRLALGNPHVAIRLKNDGKLIFETFGDNDLLAAAAAILGKGIAEHLIPVNLAAEGWRIQGFVSMPFYTRSSRKSQYFYVNKRWITNPGMRYALDHAYRAVIPKGRYPVAILFLETPGPLVDVNVDPTKNTVRISDEKTVLDLVINGVREALSDNRRAKKVECDNLGGEEHKGNYSYKQITAALDHFSGGTVAEPWQAVDFGTPESDTQPFVSPDGDKTNIVAEGVYQDLAAQNEIKPAAEQSSSVNPLPFNVLAQLAASYILYEKEQDLYIVDQHAAHERIRYEAISNAPSKEVTQLVLPQTVVLSPAQIALIEQLSEELEETGFQFDFFGGNFIVLREVPIELSFGNPEVVFTELMELTEDNLGSFGDLREAFVFSLACKTAVKAGQPLSQEEMEALVEGLAQCQDPLTCPHGRPTTICLSKKMLLKEFKRT